MIFSGLRERFNGRSVLLALLEKQRARGQQRSFMARHRVFLSQKDGYNCYQKRG